MKIEEALLMLTLHSKQVEEWSNYILNEPLFKSWAKYQAKFKVSEAHLSCRGLNKFLLTDDTGDYELSAQLSDTLLKMAILKSDKLKELTDYIDKFVESNREDEAELVNTANEMLETINNLNTEDDRTTKSQE